MTDPAEPKSGAVFRPSKPRKVFRQRNTEDDARYGDVPEGVQKDDDESDDANEQVTSVRRPAVKKHGISFSGGGPTRAVRGDSAAEMALVPMKQESGPEVAQDDRFVKPTGKVVVEDKHLTAYVDSKLAELQSSSSTTTSAEFSKESENVRESLDVAADNETCQALGHSRSTVSAIPSKAQLRRQAYEQRRDARRKRRHGEVDPSAQARDAMIESIMQEAQVPMYDRSSSTAEGMGSDEAAAEAFRAEFLADLDQHNRRKPLAPPAARGSQAAAAPIGPKLGGSRSQREKMKALEEAKNASPGKK